MGALIAGVMISTFPYTLDVVAKVTSMRDFFVTLFFVGLGMEIPMPTWGYRAVDDFLLPVPGRQPAGRRFFRCCICMRQGYRVSLLPAINLCQMSELSLVLLALGKTSGDVSDNIIGIAAFSFAFLAVGSTYAIFKNDALSARPSPWLDQMGLHDLDQTVFRRRRRRKAQAHLSAGIFVDGQFAARGNQPRTPAICCRKSSSWISIRIVHEQLRQRGMRAVYGDITQRDMLHHAGVAHAEIIICSLPNMVLNGADNLKMLRQLRELNPHAQIIVHAELLSDIPALYAAGASYVTAPRLLEAADLLHAIEAAEQESARRKTQGAGRRIEGPQRSHSVSPLILMKTCSNRLNLPLPPPSRPRAPPEKSCATTGTSPSASIPPRPTTSNWNSTCAARRSSKKFSRAPFREIPVLGEEGDTGDVNAEYRWVIDPIDGTVNYFFGMPHAAVSIALQTHASRGKTQVTRHRSSGVIYDPFTDELWTTMRGEPDAAERKNRPRQQPLARSRKPSSRWVFPRARTIWTKPCRT